MHCENPNCPVKASYPVHAAHTTRSERLRRKGPYLSALQQAALGAFSSHMVDALEGLAPDFFDEYARIARN